MVTNTRDDRADWDIILRYLVSVAHSDVLIEWHGKRWFYTQPEHINRGIFMLPERAPEDTPVVNWRSMSADCADGRESEAAA